MVDTSAASAESTNLWCPACRRAVPHFAEGPTGRPNARCPLCQALERHRLFAVLVDRLEPAFVAAHALLDIAPHSQLRGMLKSRFPARYIGFDISPHLPVDTVGDICQIPFADEAFQIIVCSHVFEHIVDDRRAMREVARVLHGSGIAIVQVPRRQGRRTEEDPDATPEQRLRRFGQEDHVRYYGMDFEERLTDSGLHPLRVVPRDLLTTEEIARFAVMPDEEVWLCARDAPPRVRLEPEPLQTERLLMLEAERLRSRAAVEAVERPRLREEARRAEVERWRGRYTRLADHDVVRVLLAVRRWFKRLVRAARRG